MENIGVKQFFIGVMLWGKNRSGLSFENRRITNRIDRENMEAFFYAFDEKEDVLFLLQERFKKNGINSIIIPYEDKGYILETERNKQFTEEYEKWYVTGD